jgi:catechol 2,3-dioxygenase-like lactoylglutathione lyase family enzyme
MFAAHVFRSPSVSQTPVPRLLSHIDLRVRDRSMANVFYGALFKELGATGVNIGTNFTTLFYDDGSGGEGTTEWFGFTEERDMVPGSARIAIEASSREVVDRVGAMLASIGAQAIEGPEDIYGYYAVFFEDPDGNKLEVCYVTS